jgi:hypothetical protein
MVATDYIETGASTAQAGILEDLPRLDYSGGASCPSLLLEPSRTNLLGQSEYYNVDYVKNQVTITDNAITSPEGLQNASKLIPDNGTGGNRSVGKAFTGLSGIHTFSTFAKAGEYGYVALRIRNAPSGFVMFDLNDGLIHYENNNAQYVTGSAKIEDYGNGWYRCSASFDPSGSVTAGDLYPSFSVGITGDEGGQWNGDGVSGIYIYGSQFEAGNYPTSYIPTMGSAVTRAYDYIKLIDLQSKGIITASQGTFLTELDNYNVGSVQLDVQSPNLDYALRSTFRFNHTDIFKRVNGVQTLVRQIYGSPAGRRIVAMSWNGTSLITSVNGVSYTDTIDGSIAAELSKIDRPNFNGTIFDLNRLLMFPTQLTEAELNALTTL